MRIRQSATLVTYCMELRMISQRTLVGLVIVASTLACTRPRLGPGEISNSQFISEEEVDASRGGNALEVIQKLRANFLTYRGETSFNKNQSQPYPTVWVDGQEYGTIAILRP